MSPSSLPLPTAQPGMPSLSLIACDVSSLRDVELSPSLSSINLHSNSVGSLVVDYDYLKGIEEYTDNVNINDGVGDTSTTVQLQCFGKLKELNLRYATICGMLYSTWYTLHTSAHTLAFPPN